MRSNSFKTGILKAGICWRNAICLILFVISTNVLRSQNYSVDDTITEYPNKGTFYHDRFEGRKTASGEIFNQNAFTAAHWRIKLGTHILVTNQNTGLQVIVKVNDRCPRKGVIDMTRRAATAIGIRGCQPVTVRILPDGYAEKCLAQDAQFDSVQKRPNPPPPKTPETSTKTAQSTEAQSTEQLETPPPKKASSQYNLVLFFATSHGEAFGNVQKLPSKYQSKVLVEPIEGSNDLRVTLDVRLPKQQANALAKELSKNFPQVTVAPAE